MGARYVGRLGRGEHRWPFEPYRTAWWEILGKTTNADPGFFIMQGHAQDPEVRPDESRPSGRRLPASGADPGRPVSVAAAEGPAMMARAAVRVTVSIYAETVTVLVSRDDMTGAVAVLAGPVEVMIEPSDVVRDCLAPVLGIPATAAGPGQVCRLPNRRCR
ncbi:hypothetical protein E1258_18895 [Micromonospora sp. KC207]|uniref:hypothetical protein n=1 Tax=Micromonospora sp. KC207 TaxID=2530377 RepID=UPI001049606A|nr:hypothetical protein [Micromonospora sp. KC207]TDC59184.1 hypothetical protein E1258_18895 [Micromonospora sp. KC207]